MLQTAQLTVGYVAGFIAAAIFLVRLWAPNVLTLILSSILRDTNSAATWTVASRALQRSHWPTLLRSDSVKNHGVRKDVIVLTWLISLMGGLIAIAGVVTPLGLYEALMTSDSVSSPFRYIKDLSPFGYGTPDRSNLPFTRICSGVYTKYIPCPFTDTVALITTSTSTGNGNITFPYGYDLTMPAILSDIFSSGTKNDTTVSNYFDIQWRRYQTTRDPSLNNGSTYLVGAFRPYSTMALNNALQPVEGLILDTINGRIGLRNHTVPPGYEFGVSWEEDILFIEPETACVDTNTTIDYSIAETVNSTTSIIDVVITDRGGFVNLPHTLPTFNMTAPQTNADLANRAYTAAYYTNAYTMLYFNITNRSNETLGTHAFAYVDSVVGKTFRLPIYNQVDYYNSLAIDATLDFHLNIGGILANNSSPLDSGPVPNPFNVSQSDFDDISLSCRGVGGGDYANITNVLVNCGIMRGVPRRVDAGPSILLESGSKWSQPLYACATAVKAVIKTVSFTYNGTDGSLQNLNIAGIKDKQYTKESDKPLWGVEYHGTAYNNIELSPLWGLISPQFGSHPNVSSIRQESLYLPGWTGGNFLFDSNTLDAIKNQNLPGSDFYTSSVAEVYRVGNPQSQTSQRFDYSGSNNMAMWVRWQKLTSSPSSASLIPNLIFTDYAAAAVVGTKGVLGAGNAGNTNAVQILVTPTVMRIRYRWAFAVPALIVLAGITLSTLAALITLLIGKGGVNKMRHNLQRLSPGRIFTGFLYPELTQGMGQGMDSKEWSERAGKTIVDLTGDSPVGVRDAAVAYALPAEKNNGVRNGVYERAPSGSTDVLGREFELVESPKIHPPEMSR